MAQVGLAPACHCFSLEAWEEGLRMKTLCVVLWRMPERELDQHHGVQSLWGCLGPVLGTTSLGTNHVVAENQREDVLLGR